MREVLYKDKFVEVYCDEIVIKTYYFPIATNKTIPINEIRCIYYKIQECWGDIFVTKGWGMTFYPVWWACDLRRHIQAGKPHPHYNVIIDSGTSIKQGFSVVDIQAFLKAIRPFTNAPMENRFPNSFEHRVKPVPIEGDSTAKKLLGEKKGFDEAPPSYDEAISSTTKKVQLE